jgi:hypothetical protein
LRSTAGGSGATNFPAFEWNLVDGPYHLRYHDLSGWLDRMRELLEAGRFERHEGGAGPVLRLLDPDTSLPMSELPAPTGHNPVHGDVTRYQRHPLQWPPHWRRLSGISPEEVSPRGASHSISELAAADPSKPCPGSVTTLGPVMGGTFEFDVVAAGGEATATAIRPLQDR